MIVQITLHIPFLVHLVHSTSHYNHCIITIQ